MLKISRLHSVFLQNPIQERILGKCMQTRVMRKKGILCIDIDVKTIQRIIFYNTYISSLRFSTYL